MEVGIVGLPSVGKTTLFRAMTGGVMASTRGAGPAAPNVGVAKVPDPRLHTIAQYVPTKQIVPASIRLVDIPGFATGGDAAAFARQVLANIREVDAVCHVVRCFDDGAGTTIRPVADIETMETEMILADLAVAEPALDKAARGSKSGDREAKTRAAALERVIPVLSDGRPIRSIAASLTAEEKAAIRGYGMITFKPELFVANVGEGDLGDSNAGRSVIEYARANGAESAVLCAKIEAEIAELDEADRAEMLASMGVAEPALAVMCRGLYRLLGLASFYTAGEKEVRAWTIPAGASAPEAAGAIHSDIQRGFIRAECYHIDDLVRCRTEKAVKEAGKLRSEGKNYAMQDGDVVHFLFNV